MAGMTQQKFSETYGIPKRTIEDWEGLRMKPPTYVHDLLENAILEDLAGSRIRYRVERVEKDGNTPYDSFEGMFRTSRAANEHAEDVWDRLDEREKKTCQVYVYYVREKDFDPEIGFDKDAATVSGHVLTCLTATTCRKRTDSPERTGQNKRPRSNRGQAGQR